MISIEQRDYLRDVFTNGIPREEKQNIFWLWEPEPTPYKPRFTGGNSDLDLMRIADVFKRVTSKSIEEIRFRSQQKDKNSISMTYTFAALCLSYTYESHTRISEFCGIFHQTVSRAGLSHDYNMVKPAYAERFTRIAEILEREYSLRRNELRLTEKLAA